MPDYFYVQGKSITAADITLNKEYIITNNYGAYSSSTVSGCNTRKYHGLLCAPLHGYDHLFNLVSRLDLSVIINDKEFELSTNKFPGVYHPEGYRHMESFAFNRYPEFSYKIGDVRITESRIILANSNAVCVRYESSHSHIFIKVRPFISFRDVHKLSARNNFLSDAIRYENEIFSITPYYGLPELFIQTPENCSFFYESDWWNDFEYERERDRGYPYREDLFCPGYFKLPLEKPACFLVTLEKPDRRPEVIWEEETENLHQYNLKEPDAVLRNSASKYLYTNGQYKGIIAGYHWFGEWGRDTLISLAGITLCRNDYESALSILRKYTDYIKNGLLPNIVSTEGGHAYNSIDSSLLYFWAVEKYLEYSHNAEAVKTHLLKAMLSIAEAFLNNRVPIAELREDGLIYAGTPDTNYTWMDANASGRPVTPRHGAAVEINALWYNALCFLLKEFDDSIPGNLKLQLHNAKENFENNFESLFWNEDKKSLLDVYRDDTDFDSAIRPNQLFALGLPYTCISREKALIILATVKKELVTPYGLRTLSPGDPLYISVYSGDQNKRDAAYHQGLVWPWLAGIFCDALFKYTDDREEIKNYIKKTFKRLWNEHLNEAGIYHISEIFEPEEPYSPCGCIAQAWSVAEVLRIIKMLF